MGQTVNLLRSALRRFESSPAHQFDWSMLNAKTLSASARAWNREMAPSSSGLGRHPLKVKIAGSNPAGVTNTGPWCSGLTCHSVTVEIGGSNPLGPAKLAFKAQAGSLKRNA